jgi:hypothetical protein
MRLLRELNASTCAEDRRLRGSSGSERIESLLGEKDRRERLHAVAIRHFVFLSWNVSGPNSARPQSVLVIDASSPACDQAKANSGGSGSDNDVKAHTRASTRSGE